MATPPSTPTELKPKALQRLQSQEATSRKRGTSIGDGRWRTSSFSEPGRIIVVAVDESPNSKNAFDFYLTNIHRSDDLVVITHIPEPPKLPSFSFRGGMNVPTNQWKEIMDEANKKVTRLEGEYEDMCLHKKIRYKVRGESNKKAGEGIVRIAEEEGADMIMMACRGLGMFKRAMLGSVSEFVVKHANRPVMVIPLKK